MAIRTGEMGKKVYVITSFDMSSNTLLEIIAVPPSGTTNQKTWTATIGGALGAITLEDGTAVASVAVNESMFYELAATTDLDEVGTWTLVPRYTNTVSAPDDVFIGAPVSLIVSDDFIV